MTISKQQKQWYIILGNVVPPAIIYIPMLVKFSLRPENAPEDWSGLGIIAVPVVIVLAYGAASVVSLVVMAVGKMFHKKLDFAVILTTVMLIFYAYLGLVYLWQKSLE